MENFNFENTHLKQNMIEPQAIIDFRKSLQGKLIKPDDAAYAQARLVWNGMIDKHPALIAQCANVRDVQTAVQFARRHELLIAVRGGGHNVAGLGTCDGGLVIDLSAMNDVTVDPEKKVAVVSGGATLGDLDAATQAYGLAAPGGVVSDTGVAGLTLGGGYGHLRNKFGLTCDNLIAAEVVTADGTVVRASENENRDLLWGLRGGGGNFGVVTHFEFQLHELGPEVSLCMVFHPADKLENTIRFFRDFTQNAPEEVSALAFRGIFPEGSEAYPEALHGQPFVAFMGVYAGDPKFGEEILSPLRVFDTPLVDFSGITQYQDVQKLLDEDYPKYTMRYYWKSQNIMELTDRAIAVFAEHAARQPSQYSTTDLWHIGNGIKKYDNEHASFNGRYASYLLNPEANWVHPDDDAANINWLREFLAAMKPFSDGGLYLNFAGFQEEGDAMIQAAFGSQYQRLVALKQKYDPDNLFRLNQNIDPAS